MVQNFFTEAYVTSQSDRTWASFLDRLGLSPESEAAEVLKDTATVALELRERIDVSDDRALEATEDLARMWNQVRQALKAEQGSSEKLTRYLEGPVRRSTKYIVSPSSVQDLPTIEAWSQRFDEIAVPIDLEVME